MQYTLEYLRVQTQIALFEKENDELLRAAIRTMQDIYTEHTGIDAEAFSTQEIMLPSGMAISPYQAAFCLTEMERTVVFLRGIHKAILQKQKELPGERINIMYAGCGPYAALLTPFTALFSEDQLSFWLLDISEESVISARQLFASLGVGGFVRDYVCADAATYQLPTDAISHIVVSETMQKSLWQEPQVAIMLNLLPQMDAEAIFIPESIRVSVKLISDEDNVKSAYFIGAYNPPHIDIGTIYTIGRQHHAYHHPVELQLPEDIGMFHTMHLFTDITVYADEQLVPYSCSLNVPVFIDNVKDKGSKKLCFTYEHTDSPGFRHRWVE